MSAAGTATALPARRWAMSALLALAALAAVTLLLWTALLWYRYHTHIPWRDLYLIVRQVQPVFAADFSLADLAQWFELHYNAHRIFLLRALVALDLYWFHGENHLLYATGWLSLGALFALLGAGLRSQAWPDRRLPWLAFMVVAIYLFSPSHLWNILNPVNVSWHLTLLAAVGAFALVLCPRPAPGMVAWLGAFALASVAAFSTFAGVLVWLVLPLLALYLRSPLLIPVSASCLLATGLYCQGISSDAAVLTDWSDGTAEQLQQIHAQGTAALEANNGWQIFSKSLAFLGWPLGWTHPRLAALLALLSLLLPGILLWDAYKRWRSRGERQTPLVEIALVTALLAAGIALVTQFGRIIPQPVHVQGPSQERFQTVVLGYWACISLLLLCTCARRNSGFRLAGAATVLALAGVLTAPGGAYLREEILSMEYAARLQTFGEREALRKPVNPRGLNFKPERIFLLDSFLAEHALAYQRPLELPLFPPAVASCKGRIVLASAELPSRRGFRPLALALDEFPGLYARSVIVGAAGNRLFPVHRGDYTPWALWQSGYLEWLGYIDGGRNSRQLPLALQTPAGLRPYCTLRLDGR